jgi:two-component system, cell cycle response regulator
MTQPQIRTPPCTSVDLSELRLGDALALLGHGDIAHLPNDHAGPRAYVQKIIDGLCEISLRDPLTGLSNRRHFHSVLLREIEHVARSGNSALLLMLDIDHFKKINDQHGHLAGDQVLQAVTQCIASCVRPRDTVARYGGEEFAVILPDCKAGYGDVVAERIRKTLAELSIQVSPVLRLQVTLSIGGAFAPVWVRSTSELWIESADTQLYRAKAEGRNRVCINHPQTISVSAEEKSLLFSPIRTDEPAWIASAIEEPADNQLMQRGVNHE